MSEEKKPSYMQQLDEWTKSTIINPLAEVYEVDFDEEAVAAVCKAIREKTLESFRNGQKMGPRVFNNQRQKGGRQAYVR